MRTLIARGCLVLLLGLAGCARAADDTDPAWVAEKFIAARQSRDLSATMDCFVEQPELRSSVGVGWTGRDAVRTIMASRLGDTFTVGQVRVAGDHVTWSEHVRRGGGAVGTIFDQEVEAIVVGDHIARLETFVAGTHPVAAESVPVAFNADLLVPLGVLLLVALAVLVWPPPRPAPGGWPGQHGYLLSGLREYMQRRG